MNDAVKRALTENYGEYYSHRTLCGNCGQHQSCYIKKGTPLNGLTIRCEICDCLIKLRSFASNWTDI